MDLACVLLDQHHPECAVSCNFEPAILYNSSRVGSYCVAVYLPNDLLNRSQDGSIIARQHWLKVHDGSAGALCVDISEPPPLASLRVSREPLLRGYSVTRRSRRLFSAMIAGSLARSERIGLQLP